MELHTVLAEQSAKTNERRCFVLGLELVTPSPQRLKDFARLCWPEVLRLPHLKIQADRSGLLLAVESVVLDLRDCGSAWGAAANIRVSRRHALLLAEHIDEVL